METPPGARSGDLRVAEVLAALSLTTDLASGLPFEKGMQTCLVATAFCQALGWGEHDQRVVFQAALLRAIGCTAHAPENAALFGDDVAFQAALKRLDPGDGDVFAHQLSVFGSWAPGRQAELAARFVSVAPVEGPVAVRAGCEVSQALGRQLGLEPDAIAVLDQVYERFDGLGIPDGVRGDALYPAARLVHLAEQAVLAFAAGGPAAAVAEVRRRAGGHLDPALAARFAAAAGDGLLSVLGADDVLAAVVAAEPGPVARVPFGDLHRLALALAAVADLKGRFLLGHSSGVAALAAGAAAEAGLPPSAIDLVRVAGLLHDLGRVAVSSEVWDRPGPLGAADWERVRLHSYWTDRILRRCPALEPVALIASSHHERHDGSGYHRGTGAGDLPMAARLVAAADVLQALRSPRGHRPALPPDAAARELAADVAAGRLDAQACDAVLAAAGMPRLRRSHPCGLTEREVEVLALASRGLTNRQIAAELAISDRTVGHHLAHVYDKTGRRTRAGVAVFAIEHGLLS